MAIKPVKCPLCRTPTLKGYIQKSGVCIKCDEGRAAAKSAAQSASEASSSLREQQARSCYLKLENGAEARRAAQEKAAQQKALDAEHKQMLALHKEQASIALARRSLLHYVERKVPGYKSSWHLEDICRRLEQFVAAVAREESPRLILQLPPRSGKALADQTLMLTANRGWTTHGDLNVGDYVFGLDGKPTKVVAVSPEVGCDVELAFSTGESLVCHERHEWMMRTGKSKDPAKRLNWSVRETSSLLNSVLQYSNGDNKFRVPEPPTLFYEEADLPMDPYVLGIHISDGTTGKSRITHTQSDIEHIDEVERRGYRVNCRSIEPQTNCYYSYIKGKDGGKFIHQLRSLGIEKAKFIPEIYFQASAKQRLDLLAALIDGDGHIQKTGEVCYYTNSTVLKEQVVRLARTLGCIASSRKRPKRVRYYKKPGSDVVHESWSSEAWVVSFYMGHGGLSVQLPRKKARLKLRTKFAGARILTAKRIEPQLGRCIQVEAPDGMYLAGETLIPTHNSEIASDCFPAWVLGQYPNWSMILTSYSDELPSKFSRSIRSQLQSEEYQNVFPRGATLNPVDSAAQAWSTEQGGALRASGILGAILGFGAHILICDDILKNQEVSDSPGALEKIWDNLTSTMYSRLAPGGGIVMIGQRWSHQDPIGNFIRKMEEEKAQVEELRRDADALESKGDLDESDLAAVQSFRDAADELDASMDKWEIVSYKALAEADEWLTDDGDITELFPGQTPTRTWRKLRSKGEALHPERYTRYQYLKIKRASSPRRWSAMYMQSPQADENSYFALSDFIRYKRGEHPRIDSMLTYSAFDLAAGTKQSNDFTVGIVIGMDHKGQMWFLDEVRGKFNDLREVADKIIDLHVKWKVNVTGVERTVIEMVLGPILKTRMRERGQYISMAEGKDALKPISDKQARARTLQGLCRGGAVYVPEGEDWDAFITEMVSFGSTTHDDRVDAAAWAAILATRNGLPRNPALAHTPEGKPFVSWYDEMLAEMGGQSGSYMES